MIRRRRRKDDKAMIKNLLRDPLDQYSDWPCNKCDFSLEVTISYSSNDQNLNLAHAVNIRCPTWRERSTRWRRSSTISPASKRIQSAQICGVSLISRRKDLKRLEFFVKELQGAVLHPNHYLLLIARCGKKLYEGWYQFYI